MNRTLAVSMSLSIKAIWSMKEENQVLWILDWVWSSNRYAMGIIQKNFELFSSNKDVVQ